MGAVRLVFRARLRGHWRAWLGLSLLVALVSGLVMAAAAAGQRTDQAFPRYLDQHGYDAIVYTVTPRPQLQHLPEVAAATPVALPFYGPPTCSCRSIQVDANNFTVREVAPAELPRVAKLVAGRMPDQSAPDQALASFTMARDNGVQVGTRIRIPLYAPSQQAAAFASLAGAAPPKARGPVITLTIVGIAAAELEFPSGQSTAYDVYTTGAFAAASRGTPALQTYYVRLHGGPAALARFESRAIVKGEGVEDLVHPAAAITTSIRPQAVGWWILAVLAALAGLAVLAQASARQALAEDADYPVLTTLGLRPRDLAAVSLLRATVIAVAGAAGGVAVAVALSPIAPLGEARLAEPAPGLLADWPLLGYGALATVLVLLAVGAIIAWRAVRPRPGRGVPPVDGGPGCGRAGRPGGRGHRPTARAHPQPGRAGTAGGRRPDRGGGGGDGAVRHRRVRGQPDPPDPVARAVRRPVPGLRHVVGAGRRPGLLLTALTKDPAISGVTAATDPAVAVNGVGVRAIATTAVRGPTLLSAVKGRLPRDDREIALGVSTLRRAGARIGSSVALTVTAPGGASRSARFRVVGLVAFPADFSTGGLGTGAALTTAGYLGRPARPGRTSKPARARCSNPSRASCWSGPQPVTAPRP